MYNPENAKKVHILAKKDERHEIEFSNLEEYFLLEISELSKSRKIFVNFASDLQITPQMQITKMKILLASNSPRRRELLKLLVSDFAIAESREVDETFPKDMPLPEVPKYLSRIKAEAYKDCLVPDEVIITADTVVINKGKLMGKPKDIPDAIDMLNSLMGHTHTVVTGVTLTSSEKTETFSESTEVTFGFLGQQEIENYVNNYRPLDKAGAYGIQEWIGAAAIQGIHGCFYNVMGLPLHTLYLHLKNF